MQAHLFKRYKGKKRYTSNKMKIPLAGNGVLNRTAMSTHFLGIIKECGREFRPWHNHQLRVVIQQPPFWGSLFHFVATVQ